MPKMVFYTISLDGKVTSVNKACEAATGWSAEELIGRPSLSLLHPDEVERSIENHKKILNNPLPEELEEFQVPPKSPAPISMSSFLQPLYSKMVNW